MHHFAVQIPYLFARGVLENGSPFDAKILLAVGYLDSTDSPITCGAIATLTGLSDTTVRLAVRRLWKRPAFAYHYGNMPDDAQALSENTQAATT